jgi:rare lipoprotein A (peptidoglycan hydrolase)
MPLPPNNRAGGSLRLGVAILSLGLPLISSGQMMNPTKPAAKASTKIEGNAVWYQLPPKSLAKRRAGKDELTAAHNRLPIGTRVRVTHLKNGKSVVVRITDRGITSRRAVIDLCKEAAEKLDMIHEGSARVSLEILPDDKAPPSKTKAPSQ